MQFDLFLCCLSCFLANKITKVKTVLRVQKYKEFSEKLNGYHAQFRTLATAYNQIVKEMHVNFSEHKTMALMQRLEKTTKEMTALAKDVISLAHASQQAG